ncbi:MFS transporter [Arthrobacter sp. NA-172]|uniref:MFS transporter n=1 Tax=Arthrobacter sp. NA-172 TaxID=3367524 RepID=UPI0037552150
MGEANLSNLGSIIIDLVFIAGRIPALKLIETWGRRPLIILSFAIMAIPLFILGFVRPAPVAIVVGCFVTYALFSGGLSILECAYRAKSSPPVRASAVGITTAVSRIGAALGNFALPFGLTYWASPNHDYCRITDRPRIPGVPVHGPETKGMSLAQTGGEEAAEGSRPLPELEPDTVRQFLESAFGTGRSRDRPVLLHSPVKSTTTAGWPLTRISPPHHLQVG